MTKSGSGNRATFVSPYLRRPLRSLNKVLSERDENDGDETQRQPANDGHDEAASSTWSRQGKPAVFSD